MTKSKSEEKIDQTLRDEARDFVAKHGLLVLLDVCQSTINKTLVRKGIVTASELRDAYLEDIRNATKREEKSRSLAHKSTKWEPIRHKKRLQMCTK